MLQCSAKVLRTLMSYMAEDWSTIMDKQERKTMLDTANITRKLSIRSTVLALSVVMLFIVLHYVATRQIGRQLYFRSNFPYNATKSPYYELTLVGELAGSFYAATSYTAVDTFIATLVLHVCSQLSNVRYRLSNLSANTNAEFHTKLGNIVKKHEYLNRWDRPNEKHKDRNEKLFVARYQRFTRNFRLQLSYFWYFIWYAKHNEQILNYFKKL